jgi:uncharacterized damage-inducible protein DinB
MNTAIEKPKIKTIGSLIKNYVAYNLWANNRLVEWLKRKPASLLEKEIPSSFPSIRLTLTHIWQTEKFWLAVIQQQEFEGYYEFKGSVYDLFNEFTNHSKAFSDYLQLLSDQDIGEEVFISTPWFQSNLLRYEYIQHAMNHSTYHRGQVVSIGRNLGFTDAPMTDYNYYNVMEN